MICENCNKNNASVFLTQIINGEKKEFQLCSECAAINYNENLFDNLFKGFIESLINDINFNYISDENNNDLIKCSKCGLNFDDITKIGKVGCSNCYSIFKKELNMAVKNIQGSTLHTGKFPKKSGVHMYNEKMIEELKGKLKQKIKDEQYEEAAIIRDEIKKLEGNVTHG